MDTAMVVDDERFFLTVLGDFISERLNMRPVLVQDGEAALALLETESVDIVLLDIIMPGMDGLQVLRKMKDRRPTLPIVMVTATSVIDHAIGALREGADDFVRKPVDLDELAMCMSRVLTKVKVSSVPPAPRSPANERRRAARVRMRLGSAAQLQLMEVSLIDISLSGALVEHTDPVRLGEIYRLSFAANGQRVLILARAVRAFASHRVTVAGGERKVVYRTGMEFVGVEKGAADLISMHIDRLLKQGTGKLVH